MAVPRPLAPRFGDRFGTDGQAFDIERMRAAVFELAAVDDGPRRPAASADCEGAMTMSATRQSSSSAPTAMSVVMAAPKMKAPPSADHAIGD